MTRKIYRPHSQCLKCPNCNEENPVYFFYCSNCGVKLPESNPKETLDLCLDEVMGCMAPGQEKAVHISKSFAKIMFGGHNFCGHCGKKIEPLR